MGRWKLANTGRACPAKLTPLPLRTTEGGGLSGENIWLVMLRESKKESNKCSYLHQLRNSPHHAPRSLHSAHTQCIMVNEPGQNNRRVETITRRNLSVIGGRTTGGKARGWGEGISPRRTTYVWDSEGSACTNTAHANYTQCGPPRA